MAKKLPKEELARAKADFDPPNVEENPEKPLKATKKAVPKETPTSRKKAAKNALKMKNSTKEKTERQQKKKESAVAISKPKTEKHAGGRPGAFEKVQTVTLKLPPEDVRKLKVKAAEQGKTMAQVIHDWLN